MAGPAIHAGLAWGPAEPRTSAGGPLPAVPAETGRRDGWIATAPPDGTVCLLFLSLIFLSAPLNPSQRPAAGGEEERGGQGWSRGVRSELGEPLFCIPEDGATPISCPRGAGQAGLGADVDEQQHTRLAQPAAPIKSAASPILSPSEALEVFPSVRGEREQRGSGRRLLPFLFYLF